jgi:transposase-like protein
MNGVQHYLWRAVEENGAVIDILVQPRRDRWAALRFFRQLLHAAERRPRVIIYGQAPKLRCGEKAGLAQRDSSAQPLS